MGNLLQAILKLIQSLFGGGSQTPAPQPTTDTPSEDGCSVFDIEIPSTQDLDSLPFYQASASAQGALDFSAQGVDISCQIQIRPSLGHVNVRGGPRLDFGVIAITEGGTQFELQGASEADPDGYRWYTITTPDGVGWVRGDMVIIGEECLSFTFITEDDLTPPESVITSPTGRFPLPADVNINQGYHSKHKAYDLNTASGTPIPAATPGLIIREINCVECENRSRPNFSPPCPSWMFRNEKWGYGYGNFVTIRHNYEVMPPSMRDHMDSNNLTGGFVYILYAHFSETQVKVGDFVQAGHTIGLTGNHGCSSAPHLHFEVRMGRDETVDGRWLKQTPVNPDIIFETN
jgi:murein DD-endopeptidase MepM/ murein hydrolase activator NlpD